MVFKLSFPAKYAFLATGDKRSYASISRSSLKTNMLKEKIASSQLVSYLPIVHGWII